MCDCESKHEGIGCIEPGCTCHADSPTVWCAGIETKLDNFMLVNNTDEDLARNLADARPDYVYFFATLSV